MSICCQLQSLCEHSRRLWCLRLSLALRLGLRLLRREQPTLALELRPTQVLRLGLRLLRRQTTLALELCLTLVLRLGLRLLRRQQTALALELRPNLVLRLGFRSLRRQQTTLALDFLLVPMHIQRCQGCKTLPLPQADQMMSSQHCHQAEAWLRK